MKKGIVYITGNKSRSSLYIGVTSDLKRRIEQHKSGVGSVFTKKYKVNILLYFEEFSSIKEAVAREKQLKNWHRDWKLNLIQEMNPKFLDLYFELYF